VGKNITMEKVHMARSRAKRCLGWERFEIETHGLYTQRLAKIASRFPTLTPTQLRVCALVKAMLPCWRTGKLLKISEREVKNYRVKRFTRLFFL
jgi:hypothetical protein